MASVEQDKLQGWWESPGYSEFLQNFTSQQRKALINDDLFAGRSVSLVLVAVVSLGALAMLLTVLATL
jgi:hypothetical protein